MIAICHRARPYKRYGGERHLARPGIEEASRGIADAGMLPRRPDNRDDAGTV